MPAMIAILARHARGFSLVALCLGGPHGCGDDSSAAAPAKAPAAPAEEPDHDGIAMRAVSTATLAKAGFTAPTRLTTRAKRPSGPGKLRPLHELAGRAMALKAVHAWSARPESEIPSDVITEFIKRSGLKRYMNATEISIVGMARGEARIAQTEHAAWRLENLWALCWTLGFASEPPLVGGQIPDELATAMLADFLPGYDGSLKEFANAVKPRTRAEIAALEDVFYCAHGAVRDAQDGRSGVIPDAFDLARDGGVIHERRHALSWSLSPGVAWDRTDLTT